MNPLRSLPGCILSVSDYIICIEHLKPYPSQIEVKGQKVAFRIVARMSITKSGRELKKPNRSKKETELIIAKVIKGAILTL
jgi:hypothetical protein